MRLPRHRATTRHLAAIYPFQAERGLGACGTYVGTNVTAGDEAWCFDPFELYRQGVITSPNVMVFGQVGAGKSAAVKTFLYRSVGVLGSPNGHRRWCGIIDPKGEYGRLAEALGLTVIKLYPGGPTKLNPLDPGPTVERDTADQRHAARLALLSALFVRTLGRSLTPVEDAAIAAVLESFDSCGATPTLRDVGGCLADPTDHMQQALRTQRDQLARELRDLSLGTGRLLSGDLRGMFDNASTERIDWNGPGVVIDVSAVLHDDHQLGLVMLCATAWLQALVASPTGSGSVPHRYLVSDEDWAVLRDPVTARFKQASFKLSRTYGVCNIGITHRIADLRSQADDGTSTAKIAMGLLADTQTRIVFQQPDDQ
ncbi:MAG: hypothetical protein J2P16_17715, partial [Mycobacterium sp.]|nr:hypothetical protein [Mycobacterium sp.]